MKKLEILTSEQEALIPIVRQEWLDLFFKNKGNLNKPVFEEQIEWLYKRLNYKKPFIWYCDSPLMVQIIINIIKKTSQSSTLVEKNNNIGDNIRANIGANNMTFESFSSYGNITDYGWVAFYDYFRRLNYFKYEWGDFLDFQKFLKSGVYDFVAFKDIIFVSACPIEVHQDSNNRLHNTESPAVRFKDGYNIYAIHGRILSSWIWEKKDTITKEMFIEEKNSEIRAAMYSVLGEKRVMEILGATEIDKQLIQHQNEDIEIIKLFKTTEIFAEIDNNPLAWVKFTCPSTGTDYLIACEPHYTDAKEAAASLSIFKKEEYSFDFRT
jgi:hypothetical protein